MVPATGWLVCPGCPAEDNLWPVESFAAWQRATRTGRPKQPICDACLFARYPRVYRSCATCGGLMYFHSKQSLNSHPQCKRCQNSDQPTCARCKEALAGRATIGDVHVGCFLLTESTSQTVEATA